MARISNTGPHALDELSPEKPFIKGARWWDKSGSPENKQIYYVYDGVTPFSEEEIEEANAKEQAATAAALEVIAADGFIEFPVFFHNVDGELIERSAWIPKGFVPSNSPGFAENFGMNYNVYIPSYGRSDIIAINGTVSMLRSFGVENWYVAIDPSQYEAYKKVIPQAHIIIRDIFFRDESMTDITTSLKTPNYTHGTAGIYNFLLSFSRSIGEAKYWTMDDDIPTLAMKARKGDTAMTANQAYDKNDFYRCSKMEESYGFSYKKFMKSLEDTSDKARNPGFVALEKFGLVFSLPVYWKLGTRAYSYYLSDNSSQINHIGALNNDVTTSIELSKRGMVTMLFEGICYNSLPTQSGGGLTEQYKRFGTAEKGRRLVRVAPQCAKIVERYSRIHHSVDYNLYNKQRLVGKVVNPSAE